MAVVEDNVHCPNKKSMRNGVQAVLGASIRRFQVEERQLIVNLSQGDGEGVEAFDCPFPYDLSHAVDYLLLVAMVGNLFRYLP